jgi:hypothetical protein
MQTCQEVVLIEKADGEEILDLKNAKYPTLIQVGMY